MYYIAGITRDGMEIACDFGFDMIERIILDDIMMEVPDKVMCRLVHAKRFSYFGDKPDFPVAELLGKSARHLQIEYNLDILREHCMATVVEANILLAVMKRCLIKLLNLSRWRGSLRITRPHLFGNLVVFHPQLLRSMLSHEKYGIWDHDEDHTRAVRVLNKFIEFLHENAHLRYVILYNELVCPHWDASGEIHFDSGGRLLSFKYFGQGNGQAYKYYPQLEVWQRS